MTNQLQVEFTAIDKVSKTVKGIQGNVQKMQPQFKKMAAIGTAGFAAVSGAVVGLSNKYATMGDDIAKTSHKLGISTDSLQEMNYWASQNGVSAEDLEKGVGRLNQRIGLAIDGNKKYIEGFETLGVKLKDTNGNIRDTDDVMKDTIKSLRDIEDPQLKAARASEIFGIKMSRELMPAIEDGSMSLEEATEKIHEMGGVMSEEATEDAEKYKDAMDNLQRVVGSVGMQFADVFIPILTDLAEKIQPIIKDIAKWIEENPELTKWITIIGGALFGLVAVVGTLGMVIGPIIAGVTALSGVFAVLLSPIGLIVLAIVGLVAFGWYLYNNWDKVVGGLKIVWENIAEFFVNTWDWIKDIFMSAVNWIYDKTIEKMMRDWEKLKEGIKRIGDWFVVFWETLKNIFKSATNWIYDNTIGRLIEGFNKLKNIAKNAFDTIKSAPGKMWEGAKGLLGLAEGGIVTSPTVARIGESGPEAVIPLNGKAGISTGGTTLNVYVQGGNYLDREAGEMFGKYLSKELRRELRQYI